MTIPPKKVVNADTGDADHVGGNDWDDLADFLNNVDKTGPVKINTRTYFRSAKLEVRNPADTFSYVVTPAAIVADRVLNLPLITATDTLDTLGLASTFTAAKTFNTSTLKLRNPADTFSYTIVPGAIVADRSLNVPVTTGTDTLAVLGLTQTFSNKTLDASCTFSGGFISSGMFKYQIFIDAADGNKYKCRDLDTGTIVSTHATDAATPIQFAINGADGKAIFIQRGVYNCATFLDFKGTHATVYGEKADENITTVGNTILQKNYSAGAGDIFIDCAGASFNYVDLHDLVIKGDAEGIGVKYDHTIRKLDNIGIWNFRTGLFLTNTVYSHIWNIAVEDCVDNGILLDQCNTVYFYGGRSVESDKNVYIKDGRNIVFYSTVLEGAISYCVYLDSVTTANEPNECAFYACSMEAVASGALINNVYDEGRGNTYHQCEFNNNQTDWTPIKLGANARNIEFHSCYFKANTASTTYRITVDAGAEDCKFLYNCTHSGGQIIALVFSDSGTNTLCLGNDSISDRLPYQIHQNRTMPVIFSDCYGTSTASLSPYTATLISSATLSGLNAEAEHPGIVKAISSTSADSGVNFNMGAVPILLQGGEIFSCVLKFSGFTNNTFRIGFGDTTTVADNVDGAYFEVTGSSTVSAKTSNNSTRTTNGTTYTASTATWYNFVIRVESTSLVRFLIYSDTGAVLYNQTNAANIPTGAGRVLGPQVIGTNSTTTGSIDLYEIDYIGHSTGGLNPLVRGFRNRNGFS